MTKRQLLFSQSMIYQRHFTKAITLMAAALVSLTSSRLYADTVDVTYEFTGQCSDCNGSGGSGTGIGYLTLSSYTPGTRITVSNFVSFSYSSPALSFAIVDLTSIVGELFSVPQAAYVDIQGSIDNEGDDVSFASTPSGGWCVGVLCGSDQGASSTWAPAAQTPEPGSFIPMAAGLLGCVALYCRRSGRFTPVRSC